jgi:hypothetical protein
MGKCFHGFHDSTPIMEWDGYHISCSQSIFEVCQDGVDQDDHIHLWDDNVFNMWVKHHGMLQFIVSNNHDAKFTTNFWRHLFQKVGYHLLWHFIHKQIGKCKGSMGCRIRISKITWMLIIEIGGPSRLGRILS